MDNMVTRSTRITLHTVRKVAGKERSSRANISTSMVASATIGRASPKNHLLPAVLKVIRYR